ncbi:glutamate 5-kinase ProB [Butyrivibrio proteoclasticus B316]|uniref:Glutamate 5-kinase n=1 Tax=Butyrivibrio proteoclasticus (strain ATCC 51982 / DSM 14932 / B316) TaxID=515622 RepID=E0RUJ6_BUTPB|nr:glutamate 5-kinase [Butyrivibrio proteoclasticus]ADL34037.1 glutamate 5-kinase ProB [Butyrivibrio proteoclasticus B316]
MSVSKKRIVVKVGTSTITNESGNIDIRAIDHLCRAISGVENLGYDLVLVSSGAIAVGANKMRLQQKPQEIKLKQAAAAVGQTELMHLYDKLFGEYNRMVGQILLDNEDIADPVRSKNLRNTFDALLENHIIPIVNENDSVSHAEIESEKKLFSDNDMLSALVAVFCNASKLIIFSDIEGLYDGNPQTDPSAKLISRVEEITDELKSVASGSGSNRGTGGMITKLEAAELATSHGIDVLITNGKNPERLYDIIDKKKVGTLFVAREV